MTDLSGLSDAQLMGMLQQPQAAAAPSSLSSMSDADLMSALHGPSMTDTAADVAKSGGIGLVKGAIGLAGSVGDARSMMHGLGSWVGDKLGLPAAKGDVNVPPMGLPDISPPTSAGITSKVEGITGKLYEPQTTAGHYAQAVGEFAPAALMGPGGVIKKAVTQAAIPGVASEAAGQATEGTAAEPYARFGGALAGGAVGPALERMGAARTAAKAVPTIEQTLEAATGAAGYKNPAISAVEFKPGVVDTLSNVIIKDLDRAKLNDSLAPKARGIVENMKTPVNGTGHTMEDLQTTKTLLGDLAGELQNGRPTQEAAAATKALKLLKTYMAKAPQSHAAAGDMQKATGILAEADANYAAGMTAQRVSEKLANADLRAASTYSGSNLNNATRQNLRSLLTSKKGSRGLTADELQTIEDTVRGSTAGNVLRAGGKLLGGGGGMHMFGAGAAGGMLGGPLGAVAVPAMGYAVKKGGDAITRANAQKIVDQILSRSPLGIANASRLPPSPKGLSAIQRMLLASPATLPTRLAMPLPVDQSRQ